MSAEPPSAERELAKAWQEWRRLAEAEGEAIGAGNWSLVAACQAALQELQATISRLTPVVRNEWAKSGGEGAGRERALNATIHELIRLARRNQTLLDSILAVARTKLGQLNEAGRNLKQIQRSYGAARPAAWKAFS
jgi:hypothetical protein